MFKYVEIDLRSSEIAAPLDGSALLTQLSQHLRLPEDPYAEIIVFFGNY